MKLKAMNRIRKEIGETSNSTDVYTMTICRCKYCEHFTFTGEANLRTHTQGQHSPEVLAYSCMFCSAFMSSLECFIVHLRTSQPKENISPTDQFASRLKTVCRDNVVTVFYMLLSAFAPLAEVVWPQSERLPEESDRRHRTTDDMASLTISSESDLINAISKCTQSENVTEETQMAESSSTIIKMDVNETHQNGTEVKELVSQPTTNGVLQQYDRLKNCFKFWDTDSFSVQLPQTSTYCLEATPAIAELPWRLTGPSIGPKNKGRTCQKCGQKLLGHLTYKHPTLSQADKEAMLLKGDAADALIQHSERSRIECAATEGATVNTMMNNDDIEEESSLLLSSERAQNLRELRANRRSRISQFDK